MSNPPTNPKHPVTRSTSDTEKPEHPWVLPVGFERDLKRLFKMPVERTPKKPEETEEGKKTANPETKLVVPRPGPSNPETKIVVATPPDPNTSEDDNDRRQVVIPPDENIFTRLGLVVTNNGNPDQKDFLAKAQYVYDTMDRLLTSIQILEKNKNPRIMMQIIMGDTESLQKQLKELQWSVYSYFSQTESFEQLNKSDQGVALDVVTELGNTFDMIRELAFQKKEYYGTGGPGGSGLKPPKLTVPKFNGNHAEWPAFKINFLSLTRTLPDLDKLRMLLEALKGSEALDSIKDLGLTTENWIVGWNRITSRYDSPREIAHAALRPLLEFTPLFNQTEAGLHKLVSTVRTTIAQLERIELGEVKPIDVLYLHLIMGRLDTKTISEFTRTLTNSNIPSLETCVKFLEKRAKDVALVREIKHNAGSSPTKASQATSNQRQRNRDKDPVLPLAPRTNEKVTPGKNNPKFSFPKTGLQPGPRKEPGAGQGNNPRPSSACPFCKQPGHRPQKCLQYQSMDQSQKKMAVKNAKLCFSCLSPQHSTKDCTSRFKCFVCGQPHHTTLHIPTTSPPLTALSPVAIKKDSTGLVPTAIVRLGARGQTVTARSLLDTGAAGCFVTAALVAKLNLHPNSQGEEFSMANGQKVVSAGTVSLKLSAMAPRDYSLMIKAHVMPVLLSSNIPSQPFDISKWDHLDKRSLADPQFNQPAPVDLIIGLPVLDQLMLEGRIPGQLGQATAYKTQLGQIVMGPRPDPGIIATISDDSPPSKEEVNFDLQKFWMVDTLQVSHDPVLTPEEQFCEDHFIANTTRLESGRYQIRWPLLRSPATLGTSVSTAINRWLSVERKLLQTPGIHVDYVKQLQDYIDMDQMEPVPLSEMMNTPSYYIPHHAVIKLSSTTTKLRVVFDASAKTSTGVSLNSLMPPGPTTQPDLFRQSIHFRENLIAIKADILAMYRQIQIHPDEWDLLRVIWRADPSQPLMHYRLKVLGFGTTAAPFIAVRVLQQLAEDEQDKYPEASKVLQKRFYMDDLSTSLLQLTTAQALVKDLTEMLDSAGFNLRKWATNSQDLLNQIPEDQRELSSSVDIDDTTTIKTLGICWNPKTDTFHFTCNPNMQRTHTKRNILSETSKVFDPLGLISPITIKSKLLMQKIWKCSLGWDDVLPVEISEEWNNLADALTSLDLLPIPRPLRTTVDGSWELHGFADASQDAYAAVVFIRSISGNQISTNLIASKTRVAPLKPLLTIPRLELQAAVLLVDLMEVIKDTLTMPISKVYYWTDSSIALHWIKGLPQRWKLFIRNRVSAIQEKSTSDEWAHVISEENPADCASRGLYPSELKEFSLWWKGPHWLCEQQIVQPPIPGMPADIDTEASITEIMTVVQPEGSFLRRLVHMGSWNHIKRILAILLAIASRRSFKNPKPGPEDFRKAEITLVRLIQQSTLPELFEDLPKALNGPHKKIRNLRPFLAEDGAIRVGGRLHMADAPYNIRHPLILPIHEITKSLIMETHIALLHAGKRLIVNELRRHFWLLNGTKHVKSVIDKCLICFRYHAQPETQLMGQLPSSRTSLLRPFTHTGVDFAGPYLLKNFTGRAGRFKAWVSLFTCMATRAIHLELVSSLSAEGFLNAFRRFIYRRGKPTHMYSDNGTNFISADRQLNEALEQFREMFEKNGQSVLGFDLTKIHWSLNPPLGPHHGGAWESCVRLVKSHLRTQLKDIGHTWEEFDTILLGVEAIVNSRPLTPMDEDPDSLDVLTPGHFLIGTSLAATPEPDLSHVRVNRLSQYQLLTHQFQALWKRWHRDYLQELQRTQKWNSAKRNLQVGDMVLMMDDINPPLHWRTGRVKAVHPGADQLVRVATMEVASVKPSEKDGFALTKKEVVRPISRLARLPMVNPVESIGTGINLIRPHTRVPVATWITSAVLMSLIQSTSAQSPTVLSVSGSTFVACLAGFIALIGTTMNLMTIYHVINRILRSSSKTSYLLCILTLSISDFIIASFLIPVTAIRFYFRAWIFGMDLCRLTCFFLYGTVTWSIFNLMFIAAFRYIRIRTMSPIPTEPVRVVISTAVLLLFMSYTLPFMAFLEIWGSIGQKSTDSSVCTILPDSSSLSPKSVIWVLGVVLPFGIIYFASLFIYVRVNQQRKRLHTSKQSERTLLRLRYTIFRVLASFLLGYQPILILNAMDNDKIHFPAILHISSMFLAWMTTILHPLVYFFKPKNGYLACFSSAPRMRAEPETATNPENPNISSVLDPHRIRVQATVIHGRKWHSFGLCIIMLIVCIPASPAEKISLEPASNHLSLDPFLNNHVAPENIPTVIYELPVCEEFSAPLSPVPACTSTAYWITVRPDASVCINMKTCANQMVSSDGSSCRSIIPTCSKPNKSTFIDSLECQTRQIPADHGTPPHIILKDVLSGHCAVGNLHLKNCQQFTETILPVPVLLIDGVLYPVSELHIGEDAALGDVTSYNCSCINSLCRAGTCHGDTTFCTHIGCQKDLANNPNPCYCQYVNRHMWQVFNAPAGKIIPDCWGNLDMVVKVAKQSPTATATCKDCEIICSTTGVDIDTQNIIPTYIKVTKNPGFVSVTPLGSYTTIQLTTHMLIAHGPIQVEIWLPEADTPVIMTHTCPRLNVCQVVTCHWCYDRWVNVTCYDWINWILLVIMLGVVTTLILITKHIWQWIKCVFHFVTWPLKKLWRCRRQSRRQLQRKDEETGLPLLPIGSPNPYKTTTAPRNRSSGFVYKGPLAVLIALFSILYVARGCSEFASMTASSTECRQEDGKETCHVQLNTRLAISPIGQRSCFKIANNKQITIGAIEIETGSISVLCDKQVLYYVPRPQVSCQSYIQCYSLYSSSDCHGDKCQDFGTNDTVTALESTKNALGWSSCLALRYPTCPWWLTRDCFFVRTAFLNPTQETFEVFNCPSWRYAVTLNITTHFGTKATNKLVRLRAGEKQDVQNLNISLISASLPPIPELDRCFLLRKQGISLAPCNDRGEVGVGRLGEIQCDSEEAARSVDSSCRGNRELITTHVDNTGVKCSSDLIDPELLMMIHPLPIKLEDGVLTTVNRSVAFDTSQSSLLEIQITTDNLVLTAKIQDGKCEAAFIKLEGCYSCLSGATLFLQAKTDAVDAVIATLECPTGIMYTQFMVSNISSNLHQVVHLDIPDVDVHCELKCPTNTVKLHIQGHLHYLSNPNFQGHHDIIEHHSITSGGLDFHWLSIIGSSLSSWFTRGFMFIGVLCCFCVAVFVALRFSHQKQA